MLNRDSYGKYALLDVSGLVIDPTKDEREMSQKELDIHNDLKQISDILDELYDDIYGSDEHELLYGGIH